MRMCRYSPLILNLSLKWGVNDQLFVPAALLPENESPVPIEYVAGQAPKPVWTFLGENSSQLGIKPLFSQL